MEEFESVLVKVEQVTVTQEPDTYGNWEVDDGSGACVVGPLGSYTYVPVLDDFIFAMTGVVDFTFGSFKLEPRDDDDINLIGLIIDPMELNFITFENCLDGLEFNISNLSNEDITISNITDSGEFSSGNPWEIEDFSLSLPYVLEAGNDLNFNVIVNLPVNGQLRDIVSDVIAIDSGAGLMEVVLNFHTALNTNADNNLINTASELIGNYPNPFNPLTKISFNVLIESKVLINVYNIKGQKIKTLLDEEKPAGTHQIEWDATDDNNKAVASGLYFYEMRIDEMDYTSVKKMLLLK